MSEEFATFGDAEKSAQYHADAFKELTFVLKTEDGRYRVDTQREPGDTIVRRYEPDYD